MIWLMIRSLKLKYSTILVLLVLTIFKTFGSSILERTKFFNEVGIDFVFLGKINCNTHDIWENIWDFTKNEQGFYPVYECVYKHTHGI